MVGRPQRGAAGPKVWHDRFVAAALGVPVLVSAWLHFRWGGRRATVVVDDLVTVAAAFAAFVACSLAAWRGGRARATWVLLAAGALAWLAGETIWAWYEVVARREVPSPSIADLAYLAALPIVAMALLVFPGAPRGGARLRSLLDGLLVAASTLLVAWNLVLGPLWRDAADGVLARVVALAYPIGDVVLMTIAVVALVHVVGRGRGPLVYIALALLAMAVTDLHYGWLSVHGGYRSGDPTDVGWIVSYLLLALAARHPDASTLDGEGRTLPAKAFILLPYVPLAAAAGTVGHRLVGGDPLGPFLTADAVVVVTIVLLRQFVAVVDNAALTASLQATIDRLHEREAQLRHLAFHDGLTGLANRALFWDRVEHAVALADRQPRPLAVLYLDLDGFKEVNDTLGHAAGDELLAAVARRLRAAVRAQDTVARLGGDEFGVLLETLDDCDAVEVASRILTALEEPFTLSTGAARVGASIGVAVRDGACCSPEEIVQDADRAMYAAKAAGKGRYVLADASVPA